MTKYGLLLEQKNKLTITPQMYQAIEIMQLTLPELINYIYNELMENPLLEAEDHPEEKREEDSNVQGDVQSREEQWLDQVINNVLREENEYWTPSAPTETDFPLCEGLWIDNDSLQEYLLEQLRFIKHSVNLSELEFKTAEYIIGNLDSKGYLVVGIEDIAQTLENSLEEVSQALTIVQQLDPPGIGARNLQECLRLQFHLIPDCPAYMSDILDYLDDLAAGHHKKIANILHVTVEQVKAAGKLLRLLDPKPGSHFGGQHDIRYIIPDATIKKTGDEYVVTVNEHDIPKIYIQEAYKKALLAHDDQAMKQFIREKISDALNLIKNIEHRRNTIHDVVEAIVRKQKDYLDQGISALKPLTMKEIAEEVGLHESTVSRISANKYVQTPRGLISVKCFFAGSIGREKEISPEKIKGEIKQMIAGENIQKPYSDQELVALFAKKRITIARRTIAKYREELGIPSSSLRRMKG